MSRSITRTQLLWVWFAALKGISLLEKHSLVDIYPCIEDIYSLSNKDLEACIGRNIEVLLKRDLSDIELPLMKWLSTTPGGRHIIGWGCEDYPTLLREIDCPPLCIYVVGNLSILNDPQLAIVGSRKNSLYGKKIALKCAQELSEQGVVVTSGLALGIDGFSHMGALKATGRTIAVMATGVDKLYPRRHESMANEIVEKGGCLITEFPLGMPPLRQNFPRRNRIISGLSLGLIVIEAELKSGTLITARLALEQNKEVYAVPGSIFSSQSMGCHQLLESGARPFRSVKDVLEDLYLPIKNNFIKHEKQRMIDGPEASVLKFISETPISIEEIIAESRLTLSSVSDMLLKLELQGLVVRNSQGSFVRA